MRIEATNPERLTALIDLVNDADRLWIEILIQARDRPLEQNTTGERLNLVVRENRLRLGRQNDGRLVTVARENVDFLAVDHATAIAQLEGSRGTVCREFLGHLTKGILTREPIYGQIVLFIVAFQAGQ